MDHIPYPKNAANPKIEIPYICGEYEDYDCQGFLDYPIRRGWAESAETFQWMDCSGHELVKRIQNWLFFGFLHEILGPRYHKESFLRQEIDGERPVIDTTTLPERLSQWTRSLQRFQQPERYFDLLDDVLVQVNIQSDRVDELRWESRLIALSVKILLQSVQQAISNIDYRVSSAMYHNEVRPARLSFLNTSVDTWCNGQAQDLCAQNSVIMYNYLAALPRRAVNLDHGRCPGHKCIANNVDLATYKTRHVEDHCQCRLSGPDISKVIEFISEGSIPLVSVAFNPNGSPQFEIIKAEPGIEYTAISHVWVGGLGNFISNELPECQLRCLSDLVKQVNMVQAGRLFPGLRSFKESIPPLSRLFSPKKQVYRPPFKTPEKVLSDLQGGFTGLWRLLRNRPTQRAVFWMDTLLIPVGEANAALRNMAIQSMALIYARAKNVLVLDAELQDISLHDLPLEQASAHVLSSSWMTRCWTLQEACLSRNWVVQFKDGIFDPYVAKERAYAVRQKAIRDLGWNDQVELIQESISWYDKMPGMRRLSVFNRSEDSELDNFINTWNHLVARSTSKVDDLHAIFANMLDLPAGEVIKLQYEQRMKAILGTQSILPLALLYSSSPKINDIQNRWIPKDVRGYPLNRTRGELNVTAEGLIFGGDPGRLDVVGLLVPSSIPRLEKFRIINDLEPEPIWVHLNRDGADIDLEIPGSMETCYIMGGLDGLTPAERQSHEPRGARFAVMGHEGRLLRLRYEYSFTYGFSRPVKHNDGKNVIYHEDEFPAIRATRTTKDQVFRLDCGRYSPFHSNLDMFQDLHRKPLDQELTLGLITFPRFRFFLRASRCGRHDNNNKIRLCLRILCISICHFYLCPLARIHSAVKFQYSKFLRPPRRLLPQMGLRHR